MTPAPVKGNISMLSVYTLPCATLSHYNFVHVPGNGASLEKFINWVSFLDNPGAV